VVILSLEITTEGHAGRILLELNSPDHEKPQDDVFTVADEAQ
jgi:hypothetical protein